MRCVIVLPLSRHVDRFCSLDKGKVRKAKLSTKKILNVEDWYPQVKDLTIQNTSGEIFPFAGVFLLSLSAINTGTEIFSLITTACATPSHKFGSLQAKFPLHPGFALDRSQGTTRPNRSVRQKKSSLIC